MAHTDERREALGEEVRALRVALDLSVRAAAKAAGVDRATWAGVEDGTRVVQDRNAWKMEEVLGWPQGSFSARLKGDVVTTGPVASGPTRVVLRSAGGDNDRLPDLSGLSPGERRDYLRQAFDVLPMIKDHFPWLYEQARDDAIELSHRYGGGDGQHSDQYGQ
jgi:hypothetical protein